MVEAAAAQYAPGILGHSLKLNGLAYLNAGDRFDFARSDSFTFSAWVRQKSRAGRQTVLSRMSNAKELFRGYTLQMVEGRPEFTLLHTFPDDMLQIRVKTALEPERWYHLAVTYGRIC